MREERFNLKCVRAEIETGGGATGRSRQVGRAWSTYNVYVIKRFSCTPLIIFVGCCVGCSVWNGKKREREESGVRLGIEGFVARMYVLYVSITRETMRAGQ